MKLNEIKNLSKDSSYFNILCTIYPACQQAGIHTVWIFKQFKKPSMVLDLFYIQRIKICFEGISSEAGKVLIIYPLRKY